jgi:RimJ/RimL family protein N-acetyltransferase
MDERAIGEPALEEQPEERDVVQEQRDQLLKLVTKGFYNELTNFGVEPKEVLRVASHLLDNIMGKKDLSENGIPYYDSVFNLETIQDDWSSTQTLRVQDVSIAPLQQQTVPLVHDWLGDPVVRNSFVPPFPDSELGLGDHLFSSDSCFFEILYEGLPVGIVGGEERDDSTGKLAMKKLVGAEGMQGKGIGKRATFGFLYYAFMILGMNKVYIHSRDINIRNINLNSRFGFELEGIFYEDLLIDGEHRDVVRMALLKRTWLDVFSP